MGETGKGRLLLPSLDMEKKKERRGGGGRVNGLLSAPRLMKVTLVLLLWLQKKGERGAKKKEGEVGASLGKRRRGGGMEGGGAPYLFCVVRGSLTLSPSSFTRVVEGGERTYYSLLVQLIVKGEKKRWGGGANLSRTFFGVGREYAFFLTLTGGGKKVVKRKATLIFIQ